MNTSYPPHRHNEVELNAIESGYFTYMLAGRQVSVQAGEVALFWGAIPHQVIEYGLGTQVHWGTIPLMHILRWELPRPFLVALLSGRMFCDSHSLYTPPFFIQWHQDLAAGRQNLPLMEIKALFFRFAQLAGQQESHPAVSPAADATHHRANQMALFMSQHFQEPLTAAQIADVVGLHPNYAMHIFKEAFGLSLIDYLTQQRIAFAQQLLITSDASVTEVAMESGFQTLSHFYNVFQRLCGVSPGKYKSDLRG